MKNLEFTYQNGFQIVSLENLIEKSISLISVPHRPSFYQIYYFDKGARGKHIINFQEVAIAPNSFLFVDKGSICAFSKQSIYQWEVIIFTDVFFQNSVEKGQATKGTNALVNLCELLKVIKVNQSNKEILTLLKLLKIEYALKLGAESTPILTHYLSNLILLIYRTQPIAKKHIADSPEILLGKLRKLLDENYKTERSTQFFCQKLGLSEKKLNQITRESFGMQVKEFVLQRVLLEAKILIRYSTLSMKEIAFELGFKEPSYFNRFFLRRAKISPQVFRKKQHLL